MPFRRRGVLWFHFVWFLGGCLSTNTYQTAQVLEQGQVEFAVAGSIQFVGEACFEEACIQASSPGGLAAVDGSLSPTVEASLRVGVGHAMDLGFRLGAIGARADLKLQVFDSEHFDLAMDVGARVDVREVGVFLPLLVSSRLHRWFALWATVQGLYARWRFGVDGELTASALGAAASFGLSIGPTNAINVRPEITYTHWLRELTLPEGLTEPRVRYWSVGVAVTTPLTN